MYNESQKKRYIENCKYEDTTINILIICFNAAQKVEEFYGKDLSMFVNSQVIDLLKQINARSRGYLTTICIYFSDYYKWCLDEGLVTDVVNPYDYVFTKKIIEEIVPVKMNKDKYFTKNQLLSYIDDNHIIDVSNKFICYALFFGVKGENLEELRNLKIEHLNKIDKTLKLCTGRTISVDDLFIDLMERTNEATHYFPQGEKEVIRDDIYEYLQTGYVIKQLKRHGESFPITTISLQKRLRVIKTQSGNSFLTISNIYQNGLLNYIVEQHRKINPNITLKEILYDKINGRIYEHGESTQRFIEEFGSNMNTRNLRGELADYIDYFK